ncbi:MAG: DUF523 domain-containing protein [Clostridiales bacterium]|nr:MAG: DUF523 domain-containing protein [Clostridiales bacterium]
MKVLVSACLLGENCKYNGGNNYNQKVVSFLSDKEIIPICPEVLAGLGTPRNCAEILNGNVIDNKGNNVDFQFKKGVELALEKIKDEKIDLVILQSRSPSCGVNQIYDGSFSGKLIKGQGLFAKELIKRGFKVLDCDEII